MDPLHKLQHLLDFESDHREIYNYIEHIVLSPKSPIVKYVPPLDAILYSIQKILHPTFATHRIPDLLDLLATVEFYRGHTLDHARDAITWNSYYQNENRVTVTLTPQEEAFLKGLESQKDSLRKVYIKILTTCCDLDMFLLWTADPPSFSDFWIRFNEYFPALNNHCGIKSPRLFHADLSLEEERQLLEVGAACCDFAQDTLAWAMEAQKDDLSSIQSAFQTKEFQDKFQRPYPDELINYFIQRVKIEAKGVQDIFRGDES